MKKIRFSKNSNSERGFAIVEGLLGAAVMGGLMFAIYSMSGNVQAMQAQISRVKMINTVKNNIMQALNSNAGWTATLADSDIDCLKSRTDCGTSRGMSFPVSAMRADGLRLTSRTDSSYGFTESGDACTGFSASGNDLCPYKYEVRVSVVCPATGACTNPQEKITGTFLFSPGPEGKKSVTLNPSRYSFETFRGELTNTVADSCSVLGGTYNAVTKVCRLPLMGDCPAGLVVVGVDAATNTKDCRPFLAAFECPAGSVLKGVGLDGVPYCYAQICGVQPLCTDCAPVVPPVSDGGGGSDGGCDGGSGSGGSDGCGDGST